MSPNQKGAIAEAAISYAAVELGIGVSKPTSDERYDLIFDLRPALIRVQCKWATREDDVVNIRCYSSRRSGGGFVKDYYAADEIDAIAAHCAELRRSFFLPFAQFAGRTCVQLRLAPTANNQALGINWADDFDFARLDWSEVGAIAQLGERQSGTLEVTGSSPVGSILAPRPLAADAPAGDSLAPRRLAS
jgi:hypothetical protein